MFSSQIIIVTLMAFAPGVMSLVAKDESGTSPANGLNLKAKRLTCSSDEHYCGNICVSSSDECCDHEYYCASGYVCGHGGNCCDANYEDCKLIGTYVYSAQESTTATATATATTAATTSDGNAATTTTDSNASTTTATTTGASGAGSRLMGSSSYGVAAAMVAAGVVVYFE